MDYNEDHLLHNGKLHDGDPDNGIAASIDGADHMNAITDELLNIILAAGMTPDVDVFTQVITALNKLYRIDTSFNVVTGNAIIRFPGITGLALQMGTGPGHHSGTYFTGSVTFEEAFDSILKVYPALHTNGAYDQPATINHFGIQPGGFNYNLHKFQASGAYTVIYLAVGIIRD